MFSVSFIIEATTSKSSVEAQFGPMPGSERIEDLSLWLAALCPVSEAAKAQMLMSTNTITRLQRCVDGLQSYVNSINSRRQAAAVLTAAGNTVSTATATLGSFITSFLGRQRSVSGDHENFADNESEEENDDETEGMETEEKDDEEEHLTVNTEDINFDH